MKFMKYYWLLILTLGLSALPAFAAKQQPTGPDSFLPWRAHSVEEVVSQVENNDLVRQRLAKHFHVSQAELVSYLRNNLRIVTIKETGWGKVYGVNRIGRIYPARDYFKKGALAFGLPDGTPVFKYACGNPLIEALPPVRAKEVHALPELPKIEVFPAALVPPMHAPEEYALQTELPITSLVEAPPPIPFVSRNSIPLIPFWSSGGGGHDNNIPEPATLLLFGGGLAILAGRRLRRR